MKINYFLMHCNDKLRKYVSPCYWYYNVKSTCMNRVPVIILPMEGDRAGLGILTSFICPMVGIVTESHCPRLLMQSNIKVRMLKKGGFSMVVLAKIIAPWRELWQTTLWNVNILTLCSTATSKKKCWRSYNA